MTQQQSLFTEEDARLLNKTISIREKLIDHLVSEGLPSKEKDVLALTKVLESLDNSIFSKAKIKIEDKNSKNQEETKEILRDLIIELHKSGAPAPSEPQVDREIPQYTPKNIPVSEGELITKTDNIDLEEIKEKYL